MKTINETKLSHEIYGLRVMTKFNPKDQTVNVGDLLGNSYHWVDGCSTGEAIDGTCAIFLDVDDFDGEVLNFDAAVKLAEQYKNDDEQVVIVGGDLSIDEVFNDKNEIVIKNAEVIDIL